MQPVMSEAFLPFNSWLGVQDWILRKKGSISTEAFDDNMPKVPSPLATLDELGRETVQCCPGLDLSRVCYYIKKRMLAISVSDYRSGHSCEQMWNTNAWGSWQSEVKLCTLQYTHRVLRRSTNVGIKSVRNDFLDQPHIGVTKIMFMCKCRD